ncbi:hypothetical protein FQA39_LY05259 [Lamprigera yunnana]|nr:hypothetical protein FQA39_LY05259 [Lamprigera yunnana]
MADINESRKQLEAVLGDDIKKQYFALLKEWFLFSSSMTKMQFDFSVRSILSTPEQVQRHNDFLLALYGKINNMKLKSTRTSYDKGFFEAADTIEYLLPPSPTYLSKPEVESRSAASELFLPDSGFIASRITIQVWESGLEGAEDGITEVMVHACQVFVKNIITAMISRKQSYRIRGNKFQYGFGLPVPDPYVRNTNHIIDHNQESKVEVASDDDSFVPATRPSLEIAEQQAAFSYSCGPKKSSDGKLTPQLLYDTLSANPSIIGFHSIHSVNLFKLGLTLEDS